MESGGPVPHLQGLSNNPYPELNESNSSHWYFLSENFFRHAEKKIAGIELHWGVTLVRVKSARVTAIWIGDRYMR